MSKDNSNLIMIGIGAAMLYFFTKNKGATAEAGGEYSTDTTYPQKILMQPGFTPGYSPDVMIDTVNGGRQGPNKILDAVNSAKEVLETVSNAEVSIKTPKGTLNIFKGRGKKRRNKAATTATIEADNVPELLSAALNDSAAPVSDDPRKNRIRKNRVIKAANRHAKNIKKKSVVKAKKKKIRKPVTGKKTKFRAVKVKYNK